MTKQSSNLPPTVEQAREAVCETWELGPCWTRAERDQRLARYADAIRAEAQQEMTCAKCHQAFRRQQSTTVWDAYKGDEDLWRQWSHAQYVENGKVVSEPFEIAAIYRDDDRIAVNLNGGGLNGRGCASWPNCEVTPEPSLLATPYAGNGITHLRLLRRRAEHAEATLHALTVERAKCPACSFSNWDGKNGEKA